MENTVFLRGLTMNMNFFVFMKDFEGKCYAETSAFWTLLYSAAVAFSSINIYWKPVSQELCWPRGYKDFERHESSVLSDDWKQKYSKNRFMMDLGYLILPLALCFLGFPSKKAVDTWTGKEWRNEVPAVSSLSDALKLCPTPTNARFSW